jgi:hypothetical protein
MELNLDRLNGLRFADFQEKQPSKTPTDEPLRAEEYKTSAEQEHALKRQIEGLGALQRKADQNKAEIDRNLEVYRTYQENIRKSEQLQTEILKGARAGEDIYSLFLKAVGAISCMTSNPPFLSQIEGDIKTIYGRGLQEPAPLRLELRETQKRLDRLREAQQRETEPDSLQRIATAIKAHEAHTAELTGLIKKAEERPA